MKSLVSHTYLCSGITDVSGLISVFTLQSLNFGHSIHLFKNLFKIRTMCLHWKLVNWDKAFANLILLPNLKTWAIFNAHETADSGIRIFLLRINLVLLILGNSIGPFRSSFSSVLLVQSPFNTDTACSEHWLPSWPSTTFQKSGG